MSIWSMTMPTKSWVVNNCVDIMSAIVNDYMDTVGIVNYNTNNHFLQILLCNQNFCKTVFACSNGAQVKFFFEPKRVLKNLVTLSISTLLSWALYILLPGLGIS